MSSMLGRVFLKRYQTTKLIGEGGMGCVYLGRQLDLGRQVVIKVMHDDIAADPKFCERFQREMLLMARFQHPYAVTLYDASLDDPQGPCIIMEYIRGITLETLLQRNGPLTPHRIVRILNQVCEVLHFAHGQGIIHRDLKPANLMVVDGDTPYEKIKVMDFGLATLLDPVTLKKLTNTNAEFAVGTPGYMCPEQVRGEDVGPRGDLYSLGVVIYELLTGRRPFEGAASMEVLLAHATEDPPSFTAIGASGRIPLGVEHLVMSCLSKDPKDRPASAREMAERYELALAEAETVHIEAPAAAEPPPEEVFTPPQVYVPANPYELHHEFEAWMPEMIAACKLKGFVEDLGGEVIENVPGRIMVHFEDPANGRGRNGGAFSWFRRGRRNSAVEMELVLQRMDPTRQNLLNVQVFLRPLEGNTADAAWRARCDQIYCDLRGYLMGCTAAVE